MFFSDATNTGCGEASAQIGPFYCPADELVYIDLDFFTPFQDAVQRHREPRRPVRRGPRVRPPRAGRPRLTTEVDRLQRQSSSQANAWVALELQADCFAGAWARNAERRGQLEPGTSTGRSRPPRVGDDHIQTGRARAIPTLHPRHVRAAALLVPPGLRDRRPAQCNTFEEM